ncbi:hypothetical protein ACFPK5_39125 [Streptomyces beijiangensis]
MPHRMDRREEKIMCTAPAPPRKVEGMKVIVRTHGTTATARATSSPVAAD